MCIYINIIYSCIYLYPYSFSINHLFNCELEEYIGEYKNYGKLVVFYIYLFVNLVNQKYGMKA